MKRHIFISIILIMGLFLAFVPQGGHAKLPEPDNIIYGFAGTGVTTVTLKIGATDIATYTMGSNPDLIDNYILYVPLDARVALMDS